MTVKTIQLPNGKYVRFGRRRPVVRFPHLRLGNYLKAGIPTPPASLDLTVNAAASLSQMYDNDTLGDCVIACIEHADGVFTGNSNPPPIIFTDAQTIGFYSGACGYVPGNPNTDQGCDIQTCLTYWANNGAAGDPAHKIAGVLVVDPTNLQECQTALWLFENLIFGVDLPDAWINPVPGPGFVWDVAGPIDPNNGHCFLGCGYDQAAFKISTWGMTGFVSNAAVSLYASASNQGELYTVISQDLINKASLLAPNGLDWNGLVTDFQSMGGNLIDPPAPQPTPNPPVPPSPPSPPSPPVPVPANLVTDLARLQTDVQQLTADLDQLIVDFGLSIS